MTDDRFCCRFRSLLAMVLAFCLVSASLWSYGAEAMADALSDETTLAAVGGNSGDHSPAGKVCNHGCHAQIHLMGLDPCVPTLSLPDAAETQRVEALADIATQPRAGPFRPPRNAFQA
jgi:hypothetical protein